MKRWVKVHVCPCGCVSFRETRKPSLLDFVDRGFAFGPAARQPNAAANRLRELARLDAADIAVFRKPEGQLRRCNRELDRLIGFGRFGLAEQDRLGPVGVIAVVAVAGVGDDELQFSDAGQS